MTISLNWIETHHTMLSVRSISEIVMKTEIVYVFLFVSLYDVSLYNMTMGMCELLSIGTTKSNLISSLLLSWIRIPKNTGLF